MMTRRVSGSLAKSLVGIGGLLMGITLFWGCERKAAIRETVRVTGASTVYPIVQMAAETLKQKHQLNIEAQAGGSTRGFEDTLAGRNHLGAMARDLTPEEAQQVKAFPIAYDGVGIVVHQKNPLTGITTEQLRKIYRKEIRNWSELGGTDDTIVVVSKAEGHATLKTFLQHTQLDRSAVQADAIGGDNAQIIRLVSNNQHAIGFVSIGEVIHSVEIGMPLRLLPLDGVEPTLAHVADKSFPMYRTLYLVSKQDPQGGGRILLDFLRSDEGKAIIQQGKYVPL